MNLASMVRRHLLDVRGADPAATELARFVSDTGGEAVLGVLFYGSRKTGAKPDPWSAYDFFVLTRSYRGFYAALRGKGRLRRPAGVVASLNAVLPPNQISLRPGDLGDSPLAKCTVIRLDTLERETSPRRRDHFCVGRLFQPTQLAWARNPEVTDCIVACVVAAHESTWSWVRPWLPATFDAATYCRTALRVSLEREIRPEPTGRAETLFEAQRDYLVPVYDLLLEDLCRRGDLRRLGGGTFGLVEPVPVSEKRRVEAYFRRSKRRATQRWFKYMMTFDDWLDYIVHKAERHGGEPIKLTENERRWPLVFMWPRVVGYLKGKDRKRR